MGLIRLRTHASTHWTFHRTTPMNESLERLYICFLKGCLFDPEQKFRLGRYTSFPKLLEKLELAVQAAHDKFTDL